MFEKEFDTEIRWIGLGFRGKLDFCKPEWPRISHEWPYQGSFRVQGSFRHFGDGAEFSIYVRYA